MPTTDLIISLINDGRQQSQQVVLALVLSVRAASAHPTLVLHGIAVPCTGG